MNITAVQASDLDELKVIIDSTELFPSDLLDNMIAPFFNDPQSSDLWFTSHENDKAISVMYCAPERMTDGTYNLYLMAVHPDQSGRGIGAQIIAQLEEHLRELNARILIIETSGLDSFRNTRSFYEKCGYAKEATVREFYEAGDDKVIYWKKL